MLTFKTLTMKYQIKQMPLIGLLFLLIVTACSVDEIEPWQSEDYIHFAGGYDDFYSFVYAGSTVQRDTMSLKLKIAGNLASYDRTYKVKQVKTYDFVYDQDEYGNIVDSAFIELPNQAIAGVHYIGFDDSEYPELVVPADSLGTTLDLILLRDESLKQNDYTLTIEVQQTEDFKPGNAVNQKITLTLSDQIVEPIYWEQKNFFVGSTTVRSVMGYYGKVKHQLLIDVTGQKWDDDFIQNDLTEEYLIFYKNVAVRELNRINEERAAQGLFPLREDDSNPNSEVYFF